MTKPVVLFASLFIGFSAFGYTIEGFPILDRLKANGATLDPETEHWMKKWKGLDLEDEKYVFPELGGSTSITLKIRKVDPTAPNEKGKSMGAFVARNSAGNPNTGIAYFNMSAILGYDSLFRPGVRYEAGPRATAALKALIVKTPISGKNRLQNKTSILATIAKGGPVRGYIKTGKSKGAVDLRIASSNAPIASHPIMKALQANLPKPQAGTELEVAKGFKGDALQLAREFSVVMTLDALLGQWDRYSGGNIFVRKDENGRAHIYAVDNDGADLGKSSGWSSRQLSWFSRYDRKVISQLKELNAFLENPSAGFLGYTDAETFVVDLGLYFELTPKLYAERLQRNLKLILDRVAAVEAKYGNAAYFD